MIKKEDLYPVKKYGKEYFCLTSEINQFEINEFCTFLFDIKDNFELTTVYFTQMSKNNYLIWANVWKRNWDDESYKLTLGNIKFKEFSFMQLKEIDASKADKKIYAFSIDQLSLELKKMDIRDKMKGVFAA